MNQLFTPVPIGRSTAANRIFMAPMTRSRADDQGVPGDITAEYYAQRAGAGLIIAEGTFPSAMGKGYLRMPGIETDAQIAGWKKVTDAVHARGGRIFLQLMHTGRISHPSLIGGETPVAPSAIRPEGQAWTPVGQVDYVTPGELALDEIPGVIDDYRQASRRAIEAGFDGVELHGASGYLPEQFLSSGSNQRRDAYGGTAANRARFVFETLKAMADEVGGDRVGIKIAPEMNFNSISDDNPVETYTQLVDQLRGLGLAYLHVALLGTETDYHALLRPRFEGAYLAGGGQTRDSAKALLAAGTADAVVFGSAFLANPDLPERFRQGAELNTADHDTFYSPPTDEGYTDYPTLVATG